MPEEQQDPASVVLHQHRYTVSAATHRKEKIPSKIERQRKVLDDQKLVRPHQLTAYYLKGKEHERTAEESIKNIALLQQQLAGHNLLLICRIKEIRGITPYFQRLLKLLKLNDSSCTFLQINDNSIKLVAALEHLVAFGFPDQQIVSKLLNTRGRLAGEGGQQVKIDNLLIEEQLGKYDIVCVEDCVEQIINTGEHYADVMRLYESFALEEQKWDKGGEEKCGFLGDGIVKFVEKLM